MNNIRAGIVDGLNVEKGTIRVTFPDLDDMVTDDIALFSSEQKFPEIGDPVVCIFLSNGSQQGFCFGTYYNDENLPPIPNKNVYVRKFNDGLIIEYDLQNQNLTISSENAITINGNLTVNGVISGTIEN
ncbi:hypothetical protein [Psychrobacillus sp. FSL K6-1464]|uniref:hypothetical protein n=1 Tax=Psychrobacillus sp. FSL K6-1464 TaxID=2921545 RepID=UPI0030F54C76